MRAGKRECARVCVCVFSFSCFISSPFHLFETCADLFENLHQPVWGLEREVSISRLALVGQPGAIDGHKVAAMALRWLLPRAVVGGAYILGLRK